MKNSKIKIIVEPSYIPTPWWKDTKTGLEAELSHNKLFPAYEFTDILPVALNPESNNHILIIGVTDSWINKIIHQVELSGSRAVLASSEPVKLGGAVSNITINRRYSASDAVKYLFSCGRKRLAFVGMDPSSTADIHRYEGIASTSKYLGIHFTDKDVYSCSSGIKQCIDCFASFCKNYDAVICNNDLSAVYFLSRIKDLGINVPRDLYLVGFGNTYLGRCSIPSLTTSTLNFMELGRQAAKTIVFLINNPMILTNAITIKSSIIVRQSTDNISLSKNNAIYPHMPETITNGKMMECNKPNESNAFHNVSIIDNSIENSVKNENVTISMYSIDSEMTRIFSLENFLMNCDILDTNIISSLSSGLSYPKVAEKLFVSDSTLRYHIEHMYRSLGVASRNEFMSLMGKYLPDASKLAELKMMNK